MMAKYIRQDHHLPHGSLEPHITNGDRVRMMTDEELAEIISSLGNCDTCYLYLNRGCNISTSCKDAVLEWLRKDADLKTIRKTEENADTFQQN